MHWSRFYLLKIFLLWLLVLSFAIAYQILDPNCLRGNLGAIDAEFALLNRYENYGEISEYDVYEHALLFSTRFKRGHRFCYFNTDGMHFLQSGMSLFSSNSTNTLELFLSTPDLGREPNLRRAVSEYKKEYDRIMEMNSGNEGPVIGLYIARLMDTWTGEFEAVVAAFGPKGNSTFAIGHAFVNCSHIFQIRSALIYLQRLHFITCDLPVVKKNSAEESADDIIRACDMLRDKAIEIAVTAEIRCSVAFPSYGISDEGVVGSVINFQKFWCRIIVEVVRDASHAQIIMKSAFDWTPYDYKAESTDFSAGKYYGGWWRRRVVKLYGASAFAEKVEELNGSTEYRNCAEECSFCVSNEQCCDRRTCIGDSSFQPFENGRQVHVCQSRRTRCAPRYPAESANHSSSQPTKDPVNEIRTLPTNLDPTRPRNGNTSLKPGRHVVTTFNDLLLISFSVVVFRTFYMYV